MPVGDNARRIKAPNGILQSLFPDFTTMVIAAAFVVSLSALVGALVSLKVLLLFCCVLITGCCLVIRWIGNKNGLIDFTPTWIHEFLTTDTWSLLDVMQQTIQKSSIGFYLSRFCILLIYGPLRDDELMSLLEGCHPRVIRFLTTRGIIKLLPTRFQSFYDSRSNKHSTIQDTLSTQTKLTSPPSSMSSDFADPLEFPSFPYGQQAVAANNEPLESSKVSSIQPISIEPVEFMSSPVSLSSRFSPGELERRGDGTGGTQTTDIRWFSHHNISFPETQTNRWNGTQRLVGDHQQSVDGDHRLREVSSYLTPGLLDRCPRALKGYTRQRITEQSDSSHCQLTPELQTSQRLAPSELPNRAHRVAEKLTVREEDWKGEEGAGDGSNMFIPLLMKITFVRLLRNNLCVETILQSLKKKIFQFSIVVALWSILRKNATVSCLVS